MSDGWGRHEVDRLLNEIDEFRHDASDAFLFFKGLDRWGLDRDTVIMPLLVREWRRIQGAKYYFENRRQKLIDDAVDNLPHAEAIRVLLERMTADALETHERGPGAPTLTPPPLEAIIGIELVRDVLEEYPDKIKAFIALHDLTTEEIKRIDAMQRESIGRFAWEMRRLAGQSHDKHVAALIGPVVGWLRLKSDTVRNCLRAFQKKPF